MRCACPHELYFDILINATEFAVLSAISGWSQVRSPLVRYSTVRRTAHCPKGLIGEPSASCCYSQAISPWTRQHVIDHLPSFALFSQARRLQRQGKRAHAVGDSWSRQRPPKPQLAMQEFKPRVQLFTDFPLLARSASGTSG